MKRSFAIVIGVDAYQNGIPPLETAVNDARAIATLLAKQYGYKVVCLLDANATYAKILKCLNQIQSGVLAFKDESIKLQEDDQFLFYFAGHGIARDTLEVDQEGRPAGSILPQDAYISQVVSQGLRDGEKRSDNFIGMQTIHDALVDIPCRHLLLILDCCFAGTFRWAGTTRSLRQSQRIYKERLQRFLDGKARVVITSAAHDEKALDSAISLGTRFQSPSGDRHSPFAECLLTVLSGREKVYRDLYADGIITANELFVYLNNTLADLTNRQKPGFCQLKGHDKGEYLFLLPGFDKKKLEPAPALNKAANPWMGLRSYEAKDQELFFGRDRALSALLESVNQSILTPVIGISGSGKSSLVKAGLIPKLLKEDYQVIGPCRPGERVLESLKISISKWLEGLGEKVIAQLENDKLLTLPNHWKVDAAIFWGWLQQVTHCIHNHAAKPANRWLLVFDQFEELVTLDAVGEASILLGWLSDLVKITGEQPSASRLKIVVTLRADFEGRFQEEVISREDWMRSRYGVPPLSMEDIRDIVTKPAAEKVLYFDPPKLIDRLVADVLQMPGALPLLSFALSELYLDYWQAVKTEGRSDRTLTLEAYEKLGGVTGSLTQRAESVYGSFDHGEQEIARRILTRMVVPSGELARRRVTRVELTYGAEIDESVQKCLGALVTGGLLVTGRTDRDEEYFEPVHDALVRSWDRLVQWVREDREALLLQRRLAPAALEWQAQPDTNRWWDKGLDKGVRGIEQVTSYIKHQALGLGHKESENKAKKQFKQDFLWTTEPRLDLLGTLLKKRRLWFNTTESDFVERSLFQRRRNVTLRWAITASILLTTSSIGIVATNNLVRANHNQVQQYRVTAMGDLETDEKNAILSILAAFSIYHKFKVIFSPSIRSQLHSSLLKIRNHRRIYSFFPIPSDDIRDIPIASFSNGIILFGGKGEIIRRTIEGKRLPSISLKDQHGKSITASQLITSETGKIAVLDTEGRVWLLRYARTMSPDVRQIEKEIVDGTDDGGVTAIAFGGGDILVIGSSNNQVHWLLEDGVKVQGEVVKTHNSIELDRVTSVDISPDGKNIWAGYSSGEIAQWNISGEVLIQPTSLPRHNRRWDYPIESLVARKDGTVVVGQENYVSTIIPTDRVSLKECLPELPARNPWLCDTTGQSPFRLLSLPIDSSGSILVRDNPSGDQHNAHVISSGRSGSIFRWYPSELDPLSKGSNLSGHRGTVYGLTVVNRINKEAKDSERFLISVGEDKIVQSWRLGIKPEFGSSFPNTTTRIIELVQALHQREDSFTDYFGTGNENGSISLWDSDGQLLRTFSRGRGGAVTHLRESIDSIIAGHTDGQIWRWSSAGVGKQIANHNSSIQSLEIHEDHDSYKVVSLDIEGNVQINSFSGEQQQSWSYSHISDESQRSIWVGFASDESHNLTVLGVDTDGRWRRWNKQGALLQHGQLEDIKSVTAVAQFNSEELVIGQEDGSWSRFNMQLELVNQGKAEKGPIQAIAVETGSEMGRSKPRPGPLPGYWIATSDGNSKIQVWDYAGNQLGNAVESHSGKLTDLHLPLQSSSDELSVSVLSVRPDGSTDLWVNGKAETVDSLISELCSVVKRSHIDRSVLDTSNQPVNTVVFDEAKELCDRQEPIPLTVVASDRNAIAKDWQSKVFEILQKLTE